MPPDCVQIAATPGLPAAKASVPAAETNAKLKTTAGKALDLKRIPLPSQSPSAATRPAWCQGR
jgi:hypothetical protein